MEGYWDKVTKSRIQRRRLLGAAGAGLTATALLAACGGDDGDGDDGGGSSSGGNAGKAEGRYSPSDGSPTPGGRFAFTYTTNRNFNVTSDWTEGNILGGNLVYDRPLTTREDERRFVLEAMESIEQPEPTRVVMKLKPGLVYQDFAPVNGRAVKASDIKATQEFITSSPTAFDKTFVGTYLDRTEVTDDRTIIYHLKSPIAYLYGTAILGSGNGQPIIPAETIGPDLSTNKPIGSGPYIAENLQLQVSQLYKKNPKFRDASKNLPYVAEREYKFITDPIASETAFRANQLDWIMAVGVNSMASLERDLAGRGRFYRLPGIDDNVIRWNMTKDSPWKQDVRVREAMWRLTNRTQLLELAQKGNGIETFGLVPASLTRYLPDKKLVEPYWQEDVAKATQLLKAANWDSNREITLLAQPNNDTLPVYQQQLARAGIKSRIDPYVGLAQFFPRLIEGSYDVFTDSVPGSGDPFYAIRHQHSKSWSDTYKGFALFDKDIDALVEKSEQTLDLEENVKLVKEIQLECLKRFTMSYTLYTLNKNYAVQNRVQNMELTLAMPNPLHDLWVKA